MKRCLIASILILFLAKIAFCSWVAESAGFACTFAVTLALDEQINEVVRRNPGAEDFFDAVSYYGDERFVLGAISAVALSDIILNKEEINYTKDGAIGVAVSWVTTGVLKSSFGRARPWANKGAYSFSPFSTKQENLSLPSGHTTAAFALSTLLSRRYGMPGLFFSIATLTAVSRVYLGEHWTSDAVAGAAIGQLGTKLMYHLLEKDPPITFGFSPKDNLLLVEYRF
ncbi:phosphatase PAP2 family protein [bacterium]|nr:phosphatase PAP2 family protein [bacterium]